MQDIFYDLRLCLVHGFIFLYKESMPSVLDPQLGNGLNSQSSLRKKKKKKRKKKKKEKKKREKRKAPIG